MKYTRLEESDLRLRKENTMLYRKIRLSKLQTRNASPQSQAHQKLETLAEVAISILAQKQPVIMLPSQNLGRL